MKDVYTISNEESQRIEIMKVIMCFGVCFVHSYSDRFAGLDCWGGGELISALTYFMSKIVCDSAVPTYFLVSSMLFYRSMKYTWKQNMVKKIRSLLVPYVIFNTLWILMMMMRIVLLDSPASSIPDYFSYSVFDWLNAYLGLVGECKPELSLLWFLRDLFLLNILASVIKWLIDRLPKVMMIFNLIIWFGCISTYGENTYTLYGLHTYALVLWIFGYYIVKYDIHMKVMDRVNVWAATLAFVVAAILDFVIRWTLFHRLFILVAVLYVVKISKFLVPEGKMMRLLAPTTFFIYLTHRFLYTIIGFFYENTVLTYSIMYFIKPMIGVLCGMLGYYILKRICPGLLGILVGDRVTKCERSAGNI